MELLDRIYKKDPDIASRKIADEVVLVPIKRRLADVNAIYLMRDDVSMRIWELIDGQRNVRQIRNIIYKEFEIDLKKAEEDLIKFLRQLEGIKGIIAEKRTVKSLS